MYYQSKDNDFVLYKGDSKEVLRRLNSRVDVIFADPPYFLSNGGRKIQGNSLVSVNKGNWDKAKSSEDVDAFNKEWIEACRTVLKDDGTIWVCGTFHNIYSVEKCLKDSGFE